MTNKEIQAQLMREVSPSATLEPPQFADQVADRVITRLTTGGEYLTRVIRERDDARRLIGSEQSARAQAEADRREVQSATARRIEDLRVSLIRAINTTLSRAGVELPTSAAATVEPVPPKYPTEAERLQADSLDRLSKLARAPEVSAASTVEPSFESDLPPGLDRLLAELADWKSRAETAQREVELETAHGRQTAAIITAAFAHEKQRADRAEKALAEAAEWRPMAELPKDGPVLLRTEPGFFAWRLNPALSKTFQRDSEYLGWLPIPPYRTKEKQ